jgi:DNA-binding CsgD family transcriptional regulator
MLIERDKPLQTLLELSQAVAKGNGGIVLVGGEAGIGKSSLLAAFSQKLGPTVKCFWGGCEALFTPRPLGPLQDMAAKLDPVVSQLIEDAASQDRIFPRVLNALQSFSQVSVLFFEDVHWADKATLDLIKYLGRRVGLLRTLLVLTFRTDEVTADHALSHVIGDLPAFAITRIDLEPLSAAGVASLAKKLGKPGDGVHEITAGNPFFVTELLARAETGSGIPRSVRDAVLSRQSRLSPQERELLEVTSIVPGFIEPWLARAIWGDNAEAVIDQCISRGVLVRDVRGLRFRHELARQATLERMTSAARKTLHARIDQALSEHDKAHVKTPLSVRVHHAAGADDAEKVLSLAPEAARQAAALGAHQQAAAHLATALRYVDTAQPELAAQLYEDWSYEAGIALAIDDEIIEARKKAIALWRQLGRADKVALNLRWLSRLHWYRGESKLGEQYIDEALVAFEKQPDAPGFAMALSARSQMHMLHDHTDEAISWGKRAIELAEKTGDMEARIHALNNVGSALMFSGRDGGKPYMEESLALALTHGFHEQAARAYTNYAEYAVIFKEFELADRILTEGIAFDTRHDLDSWTYYLIGRQAQLRMEQGRLREAEVIARGVLKVDRLTLIMKLPALIVLGKVAMRLGLEEADNLLQKALADALATGEQQYITPVRLALAEKAYLRSDLDAARDQLSEVAKMNVAGFDPWEQGEFAVWLQRCDMRDSAPVDMARVAEPRAAEKAGRHDDAAEKWMKLGLPYEAAFTLMEARNGDNSARPQLVKAIALFDAMEARAASAYARQCAKALGTVASIPKQKRGPYKAAKHHPLGLTSREIQVLELIAKGLGNSDIAKRLVRSQRTVEHHVSAVLGKMNAQNRMDVMLRLRNEPWLLPNGEPRV